MSNAHPFVCKTLSELSVTENNAELQVLLVDDDTRYSKLCERYLNRCQNTLFTVHTVDSVSEALAHVSVNDYDCLVVDYLLPDGTGTGLIDQLQQHAINTAPPTIITTADGGEHAATKAIRAGAVDFISKRNINSHSLSRSIYNAVDKFRLLESLKYRNAELVQANASLRRNRQEIMQFYHTVSHEVKTPLAAAREFISLVKDGAEGEINDGQNQLLQLAMDSCDQIKKQFTELLDMTRLESGKLELNCVAVDIDDLVTRSIGSASALAREKDVTLNIECVKGLQVIADPDRLVQVLSNLLHNAVKFSNEGGNVLLKTRLKECNSRLEISVHDDGCGIDEAELGSVFDRLYQSEHHRVTSSENGLGLGLAIAKDIVKLHGAELHVASQLNTGSTFYFELPVVIQPSL